MSIEIIDDAGLSSSTRTCRTCGQLGRTKHYARNCMCVHPRRAGLRGGVSRTVGGLGRLMTFLGRGRDMELEHPSNMGAWAATAYFMAIEDMTHPHEEPHARPLRHKRAALAARKGATRASPTRTAAQDGPGAPRCPAGTGVPRSVRAPPQRPADGGLARDEARRAVGQRRRLVRDAERLDGERDGGAVVLRLLARRRERLLLGALLDELLKLLFRSRAGHHLASPGAEAGRRPRRPSRCSRG